MILLANGLVSAGIPTAIAIFRTGGEAENELLALLDPRVMVAHAGRAMGSRHLELIRGFRFIRRQITWARPAVVFASSSNMGLVTGLCARALGARRPRVMMKLTNPVIRPRDKGRLKTSYRKRLYNFIFRSYDLILILSDEERGRLSGMFPDVASRFQTVANPYVTPEMLKGDRHDPIDATRRIVTLARMMPQKRLDRLLSAFSMVKNRDARLTILGDGPLRRQLENQARSLGIADRIDMPGFQADPIPRLRGASLFVLSSDYEGLPAAALEALACQVPVVTTDCFDSARSMLTGVPGCAVVAREDVVGLAQAIDESLETSTSGVRLREIAKPYSHEQAINAHTDCVRQLLSTACS